MNRHVPEPNNRLDRREFLKSSVAAAAAAGVGRDESHADGVTRADDMVVVDKFDRADSLFHGDGWETLNPGYWKIENGKLRRRLTNVGDRARSTGFPYHWETHQSRPMPVDYDPSLPFGMIWRRDYRLTGNFRIRATMTVRALPPDPGPNDDAAWRQFQPGYGLLGLCWGGRSLFESWHGRPNPGPAAWMAAWRDDGHFGVYGHVGDRPDTAQPGSEQPVPLLKPGDEITIEVQVTGADPRTADVTARLQTAESTVSVVCRSVDRNTVADGYFGLVGRGLLDFEVSRVEIDPQPQRLSEPLNDLHVAYALGDTLRKVGDTWHCRFMALFRSDGDRAEIRISDREHPPGGWEQVPPAGAADIVNNRFRRNTAVIDAALPADPSQTTLYYAVWKDGRDVTEDPRSGLLGRKQYVGRLPCLKAPYRLCGLSCHAINSTSDLPRAGLFDENWLHDQPTPDAYRHLDDYNFQIMLWEDDIWYLELVLYPPSTDDAYKIITFTLAGPTTRWQMMRHWNVLNPGDHDHGMDDVKGPEQIAIRSRSGLGQDPDYLQRNFQIVSHLISGDEHPPAGGNPKRWRKWKLPRGDFSLVAVDARLWRSSQDTRIWDDEGWGHVPDLYGRDDPTRSLLGEEQFAWLEQTIRTESAPVVCVTGINGLHTIWAGHLVDSETGRRFYQRDRVAADYAGWVKAGADRIIELFGSRDGIVSVYGDVHNGSILHNVEHGVYECSFGPIGRYGGREVKQGFGPQMQDYDGRELRVHALYHRHYENPKLEPLTGPRYWNFLEMHFDPLGGDKQIGLRIRNLIDPPAAEPRGGGHVDMPASATGRAISCRIPELTVLSDADVWFSRADGAPIRATRSRADGSLPIRGLVDIEPGTPVLVTCFDGERFVGERIVTERV